MAERTTTAAHQRTRLDHAAEVTEDYAEAIAEIIAANGQCRVTDLADRFGVSHVTVVRTVKRLVEAGLATTARHQPVELTAKGKRLAEHCKARHETVFRFLRAIGVPNKIAAIDAEGIEHHVSPETLKKFAKLVREQSGDSSSS